MYRKLEKHILHKVHLNYSTLLSAILKENKSLLQNTREKVCSVVLNKYMIDDCLQMP